LVEEYMMHDLRKTVGGAALALALWGVLAGPAMLDAQVTGPGPDGRWPLQPIAPKNNTLAPFMEGWYANEDGTYSISFGYVNTNVDTLYIPVGENNFLDQAQFDGVQATVFFPGRHRGVFSVTLPAAMSDTDVWWTVTTEWGDVTRVPGRIGSVAYQLDWFPRPHGSLPPSVSFDSQPGVGRGPPGIWAERTETVSVGSPLTLSVNATDPSERDLSDARNRDVPLRVVWSELQGPAPVQYTRHESTPLPEEREEDPRITAAIAAGGAAADAARAARARQRAASGPQVMRLTGGRSTASVIVTFSVPGDYVMLAQVDNFDANDSGTQDQCCWTNAYVRVNVTP
jgi:hypothetical protein